MADGTGLCRVVARPHPLNDDTVYAEATAGQTLAQMLGAQVAPVVRCSVGGVDVPRALWTHVRPKAGQQIHVTCWPAGGDNGNKLLKLVVLVVAVVYGYYTQDWQGAMQIAAIGFAVANVLIPPPLPKLGSQDDPFDPLMSLTGTSNQATPYGVIPCVIGQARFFPPHAAMPYTEISGEDQYLRMLLDLGYGNLDISDIKIGETSIGDYDDVEWEVSTAPSLFTQDVYELSVTAALNAVNDTASRTTQSATREISLDIVFNGGLYGVDNKGKTVTGTVQFSVQYRPTGTSTWLDVGSATGLTFAAGMKSAGGSVVSISNTKRNALRCGIRWTVASGQYDVRVTRGTATFTGATDGGTVGDAVWSVMRSISPQNPSTTGTLKLALRIKATGQLSGVVQTLSVLAAQKIRGIDPDTFVDTTATATQNPAWIYLWLYTQCPAVARRVADTRMDLQYLCDWAEECETKGYSVGFVLDSARTVFELGRDILAAGRGSFGMRNGRYSVVRDVAQIVATQDFTPKNSSNFRGQRIFREVPHALRVKFRNPQANGQQDEVLVYADGYSSANATRFEELDLRMVDNPDAAWRLGRYHLKAAEKRPNTYTLDTDLEHIRCERGDLVHVVHDVPEWGVGAGRVKAVGSGTIVLDELVTLAAGKSYVVGVRNDTGAEVTATVTSTAGTRSTLTYSGTLTGAKPGDLWILGESGVATAPLILVAKKAKPNLAATLTFVDAAPEVWDADSGTPPTFVSSITGTAWCAPPDPPVVRIRAGNSAPDDAGVIKAQTGVSGDAKGGIYRFHVGGGGGCVVLESYLPDMRQARDVAVGDTLAMADPATLADRAGTVTYSAPMLQPCVEIVTESRVVLRCSTTAPIPTRDDGLVLAPHLAGKRVAVRDGDGTRWECVRAIRGIGKRMVQHISVDDGCFWAGAEQGRCILHHNKMARLQPDRANEGARYY